MQVFLTIDKLNFKREEPNSCLIRPSNDVIRWSVFYVQVYQFDQVKSDKRPKYTLEFFI